MTNSYVHALDLDALERADSTKLTLSFCGVTGHQISTSMHSGVTCPECIEEIKKRSKAHEDLT